MDDNKELDRILDSYKRELYKDSIAIENEKQKFIKQIRNGLGEKVMDVSNLIKKEPSLFQKFKTRIIRLFKYL